MGGKPRRLRVRQFNNYFFESYQILQEKKWWGWKTIERIEVPSFVSIYLACYGDTGGWVSPFAKYGNFGKDGIIDNGACDHPH